MPIYTKEFYTLVFVNFSVINPKTQLNTRILINKQVIPRVGSSLRNSVPLSTARVEHPYFTFRIVFVLYEVLILVGDRDSISLGCKRYSGRFKPQFFLLCVKYQPKSRDVLHFYSVFEIIGLKTYVEELHEGQYLETGKIFPP